MRALLRHSLRADRSEKPATACCKLLFLHELGAGIRHAAADKHCRHYLAALGIGHFKQQRAKKLCLVSSLVLNLATLFLFKYFNFLASNVEATLQASGLAISIPQFSLHKQSRGQVFD